MSLKPLCFFNRQNSGSRTYLFLFSSIENHHRPPNRSVTARKIYYTSHRYIGTQLALRKSITNRLNWYLTAIFLNLCFQPILVYQTVEPYKFLVRLNWCFSVHNCSGVLFSGIGVRLNYFLLCPTPRQEKQIRCICPRDLKKKRLLHTSLTSS